MTRSRYTSESFAADPAKILGNGFLLEKAVKELIQRTNSINSYDGEQLQIDDDVGNCDYTDLYPVSRGSDADRVTSSFLRNVVEILLDFIRDSNDPNTKVVDFHQPEQLQQKFDFSVPEDPKDINQLLEDCRNTLKYQVKTGHPHYFNQLSQGLDMVSMAGEWLTATANTNMFTYEIAPIFIMMEHEVLKRMREIIGYSDGDSILAPGGSISNMYALMMARHKMFPEIKDAGMVHKDLVLTCYTSAQCHYSIRGAASTLGIGTKNCVAVPCDERGRMRLDALEELIVQHQSEGKTPFFVNCTTGTTVRGAFDPIQGIADICEKYKIWMHVDAAWGGGLLMSDRYRMERFDGVERADSITWNPHKLLGTLLQCSTFHMKEKGYLHDCNSMSADYLFQQDKHYDVQYDTGDKVIQCGRHNDIFKFWLMWRAKGRSGMGAQMDRLMDLTSYHIERMKEFPDRFHILDDEPQCVNVCFWYIPERLRGVRHDREKEQELGKITAALKARMMNAGTLMVSYQPLGDTPNFFRNIVSNQATTKKDIDFLLEELERLGHDL